MVTTLRESLRRYRQFESGGYVRRISLGSNPSAEYCGLILAGICQYVANLS